MTSGPIYFGEITLNFKKPPSKRTFTDQTFSEISDPHTIIVRCLTVNKKYPTDAQIDNATIVKATVKKQLGIWQRNQEQKPLFKQYIKP